MAEGKAARCRKSGAGRKHRILPGSKKADRVLGGLRSGFGHNHTVNFVNALPISPGRPKVSKSVVVRTAKKVLKMKCAKTKYTKTGSRDPQSKWAKSRKAIVRQFLRDIARHKSSIYGTLFVDEHSEFCVLGNGGHNGQGGKYQWLAPLKDGKWCDPADGGEHELAVPRQNPKHPACANGIFGVCAPLVGGRAEGRLMRPLR